GGARPGSRPGLPHAAEGGAVLLGRRLDGAQHVVQRGVAGEGLAGRPRGRVEVVRGAGGRLPGLLDRVRGGHLRRRGLDPDPAAGEGEGEEEGCAGGAQPAAPHRRPQRSRAARTAAATMSTASTTATSCRYPTACPRRSSYTAA